MALGNRRQVISVGHKLPQFEPVPLGVAKFAHADRHKRRGLPGDNMFAACIDNLGNAGIKIIYVQVKPRMR